MSADSLSATVPFELQSLSRAHAYQKWATSAVQPYLGQRILEMGAGIGNMSRHLPVRERLILTEYEASLLEILQRDLATWHAPDLQKKISTDRFDLLQDDPARFASENLDTIVSFNMLEHIQDDGRAIAAQAQILRNSQALGPRRLILFVPAHPWAFGSVDQAFGHFRRYSAGMLRKLARTHAPDARIEEMRYFNAVGLPGWWMMGRVLKKKEIGAGAVEAFEKICPWVAPFDDFAHKVLRLPLGQSLLSVWRF